MLTIEVFDQKLDFVGKRKIPEDKFETTIRKLTERGFSAQRIDTAEVFVGMSFVKVTTEKLSDYFKRLDVIFDKALEVSLG